MKITDSKQLGLPFEQKVRIAIGGCPAKEAHDFLHIADGPSEYNAHTHMCIKEKNYKTICVWKEEHLKTPDGKPTELAWHEYAHVLDADNLRVVDCGKSYTSHVVQLEGGKTELDPTGHGKSWQDIMYGFGLSPKLWVNLPHLKENKR